MRAIRATAAGGPDVLELVELPDPEPAADEVLVRVAAAGVNFIDTYRRSGVVRDAVPARRGLRGRRRRSSPSASDVSEIAVGDRVAWSSAPGSYAELVAVRESQALLVPEGVSDQVAAALPLQGLTAHYLVTSTFPVAGRARRARARGRRRRRAAAHAAAPRSAAPASSRPSAAPRRSASRARPAPPT